MTVSKEAINKLISLSVNDDNSDLHEFDSEQVKLMEEVCIVVDENDLPIGRASKKVCHLMENIEIGLLHRAFSVFLFNTNGELLLQQRASEKITFPDMWTNTCCSHPLAIPDEMGSTIDVAIVGVKHAAIRKLEQELGIPVETFSNDDFKFLTRIHYKAGSDSMWGEHEIDYILFAQKDVELKINPNEIRDHRYVNQSQLREILESESVTPWFKLICETKLFTWWDALIDLSSHMDQVVIHRM